MEVPDGSGGSDRLAELRSSARGWHGVQLAVLGFIGLCGVLQRGSTAAGPQWLQALSVALVLVALAVACIATVLVALAAWPLYASAPATPADAGDGAELRRTGRRLRAGIALTFVAVAVLAVAATSGWWPRPEPGSGLVEVSTAAGVACGVLVASTDGAVALEVSGRRVAVAPGDLQGLRPVTSCP